MINHSPTLAGYLLFLRNSVGITTSILPDDSPVIEVSYVVALQIVNPQLALGSYSFYPQTPPLQPSSPIYTLAVYNLATSNLLSYAPDNPDATPPPVNAKTFFSDLRTKWKIDDFTAGVVSASGDNGSNVSLEVIESAKGFTIANLQTLKDPWGRRYMGFAQSVGSLWGLS